MYVLLLGLHRAHRLAAADLGGVAARVGGDPVGADGGADRVAHGRACSHHPTYPVMAPKSTESTESTRSIKSL